MYLNCTVEIPEDKSGISKKKIKGTTYVYYEHSRRYDSDKKYNVPQCTTIGKQSDIDPAMMIPNSNYLKYFPDAQLPDELPESVRSARLIIGPYIVIRKIIQHYKLDERIGAIIGKDAGLFLDLAAYAIITENNAGQYYPEYAYRYPLFTEGMKVYSDSKVSRFLREVSRDDAIQFQNEWNEGRDHREKIYISYDSTNKHCQAGDIQLAEFGHEKDKNRKPIYNFSVAYDKNNRIPLFYEEYPGSINDVSQLQLLLEKAAAYGYKNAGFILDRGYFSEPNIKYMEQHGYDFLIMVKGCKDLVNKIILKEKGKFEDEWEYTIPYYGVNGITTKGYVLPKDEKERWIHIYYDDSRKARERSKLETRICEQREYLNSLKGTSATITAPYTEFFEAVYYHEGKPDQHLQTIIEKTEDITRAIKLCGYFAIITSSEMSAADALELYKSRDCSEKLFRGDKSYLGEKTLRVYEDEPFHTKIFIEFIALIIRNKIYTCLKDRMRLTGKKENYMTVPAAIRELKKIEMIRQADGMYRLNYAVTATQKEILQAFNLTAADAKKESIELGGYLKGLTR